MIYRALSRLWLLLGLLLLLLALLISVVRFGIPQLQVQRQALLDWVWSAPDLDSKVASLSAGWTRDGPTLRLKGLQLADRSGTQTWSLAVTEARLHLDLWQSLRRRQWVLGELQFQGLQLALPAAWLTEIDDEAPATDWQPLARLFLGSLREFELRDSRVSLLSGLGEVGRLRIERLRWRNQGQRHQGEGRAFLSHQAVSNAIRLVIDLQGPADQPEQLAGQIYLASQEDDEAALGALTGGAPDSLHGRLGFELWLERRQQAWQLALLRLGHNKLSWQAGAQAHSVELGGGQLQWLRQPTGWQLATHGLRVRRDQAPWRDWSAQLDQQQGRLSGRMDTVELGELTPILALLAPPDTRWGEALRTLAPRGQLRELGFSRAPDSQAWQVTGQLSGLALERWQMLPRVRGLNGQFSLGAERGQLELQLGKGPLDFGPYFPKPLQVNALTATFGWQRAGDNWQIDGHAVSLETPDLAARSNFRLALPGAASPQLDLYAEVDLQRAAEAYRYFPRLAMGQGLTDYLTRALQGGTAEQAKILWHGALADFPYRHGEGIFQAWVPLRQSRFQFDPGWQPLHDMSLDLLFENDRLDMRSTAARLGQASASRIHAYFPTLARGAHLHVDAEVAGEGEAVSHYLIASPLASSVGAALTAIKVEDPLTGTLKLDIPLDGSGVKVNGQVNFPNNRVTVQALGLPLTRVRGQLEFDENQTRFDRLQAELWQQPLSLDYQGRKRGEEYAVDIGLTGRWQSRRATHLPPVLQQSLQGQARWGGQLALALKPGGQYSYQASLQSDLKGLALALPQPYGKRASAAWPLRLSLNGNQANARVQGNLNKALQLQAEWQPATGRFSRFWLVTPGQPRPQTPLAVDLQLAQADAGGWVQWLSDLERAAPLASAGSLLPAPGRLSARVGQLTLAGQTWQQANLALAAVAGGQRLTFSSEETRGHLSLPANPGQPKRLHFERLTLQPGSVPREPLPLAQQREWLGKLPWLQVECLACRYGDYNLGRLSGELKPESGGARVRDLRWQLAESEFKGEASWRLEAGRPYSRVQGQLHSPNSEQLLRQLGFEPGILGMPADLDLELGWRGAPHQPDLPSLQGQLQLKTEQGVLREVSSPGARLLSVLSLGSLIKRLSLDFRDLFSEGLFFEGMSLSGRIRNGRLSSDDFLLQSGAGDMRGHGTVDLPRWQLDYRFNFVPRLTSSLSVAAAFALTPITGVYVLALSKLLEPVIDVITQVNYQVKGDIDNPQITEVGREQGRLPLSWKALRAPR